MTEDTAKRIAKYVVPRLLAHLPQYVRTQLTKPGEDEESFLFRLTEKAAVDIRWVAGGIENQKRKQYM